MARTTWNLMLETLTAYRQTHGHCQVPVRRDGRIDPLGRWCNQQRYLAKKGRLPPERVAQLTAIGFSVPGAVDVTDIRQTA